MSRATRYRCALADKVDRDGVFAMVSCSSCQRRGLVCKISSLSKRGGACVRGGLQCVPGDVPLVDFSKIEKEVSRLERLEEEAEAAEAAAADQIQALLDVSRRARQRLIRLRQQKRLLKRREQKMFDEGLNSVEELEQLEVMEELAEEFPNTDAGPLPGAGALDWLAVNLSSPISFGEIPSEVAGSSKGLFLVPNYSPIPSNLSILLGVS